jgi:hypothetical protein
MRRHAILSAKITIVQLFIENFKITIMMVLPEAIISEQSEKTPTDSLLNHSGRSPGPLTATPPLSRHPSRQPELPQDQHPELLAWDNGSFSDSPTSVRTPDGDSFEVEMLDSGTAMQNFYQQTGFSMSTQVSHNTIPAIDPSAVFTPQGGFSNHGMLYLEVLISPANYHSHRCRVQCYVGGACTSATAAATASVPTTSYTTNTDEQLCI